MSVLLQDLRYGLRMLAKNPGFSVVAVLSLALGIGANTIIFSTINGLFLHPLGISDPEHLFAVRVKYDKLNLKSIVISAPVSKISGTANRYSLPLPPNTKRVSIISPRRVQSD